MTINQFTTNNTGSFDDNQPWHTRPNLQSRYNYEKSQLERRGTVEAKVTPEQNTVFTIVTSGPSPFKIYLITQPQYPNYPPSLMAERNNKPLQFSSSVISGWKPENKLADVVDEVTGIRNRKRAMVMLVLLGLFGLIAASAIILVLLAGTSQLASERTAVAFNATSDAYNTLGANNVADIKTAQAAGSYTIQAAQAAASHNGTPGVLQTAYAQATAAIAIRVSTATAGAIKLANSHATATAGLETQKAIEQATKNAPTNTPVPTATPLPPTSTPVPTATPLLQQPSPTALPQRDTTKAVQTITTVAAKPVVTTTAATSPATDTTTITATVTTTAPVVSPSTTTAPTVAPTTATPVPPTATPVPPTATPIPTVDVPQYRGLSEADASTKIKAIGLKANFIQWNLVQAKAANADLHFFCQSPTNTVMGQSVQGLEPIGSTVALYLNSDKTGCDKVQ